MISALQRKKITRAHAKSLSLQSKHMSNNVLKTQTKVAYITSYSDIYCDWNLRGKRAIPTYFLSMFKQRRQDCYISKNKSQNIKTGGVLYFGGTAGRSEWHISEKYFEGYIKIHTQEQNAFEETASIKHNLQHHAWDQTGLSSSSQVTEGKGRTSSRVQKVLPQPCKEKVHHPCRHLVYRTIKMHIFELASAQGKNQHTRKEETSKCMDIL